MEDGVLEVPLEALKEQDRRARVRAILMLLALTFALFAVRAAMLADCTASNC